MEMREVYVMSKAQMQDWRDICKAYADKHNAKLLWVNDTSCGVEYKNGQFHHILVQDMINILSQESE